MKTEDGAGKRGGWAGNAVTVFLTHGWHASAGSSLIRVLQKSLTVYSPFRLVWRTNFHPWCRPKESEFPVLIMLFSIQVENTCRQNFLLTGREKKTREGKMGRERKRERETANAYINGKINHLYYTTWWSHEVACLVWNQECWMRKWKKRGKGNHSFPRLPLVPRLVTYIGNVPSLPAFIIRKKRMYFFRCSGKQLKTQVCPKHSQTIPWRQRCSQDSSRFSL